MMLSDMDCLRPESLQVEAQPPNVIVLGGPLGGD